MAERGPHPAAEREPLSAALGLSRPLTLSFGFGPLLYFWSCQRAAARLCHLPSLWTSTPSFTDGCGSLVNLQPGFPFLGATIHLSFMKGLTVTPRTNGPFQSFSGSQPVSDCSQNSGPTFRVTLCKVSISPFRYREQSYQGRMRCREHGLSCESWRERDEDRLFHS